MNRMVMTGASADELWPLVRDFHYSRRMPSAIRQCFALRGPGGMFGDTGEIVAGIIYGNPVSRAWPQTALELQRLVRADGCSAMLSEFVAWSLRWLRGNTETPFVISYADTGKGHHGGIYQASGFDYVHETGIYQDGLVHPKTGDYIHGRQCVRMFGSRSQATLEARKGEYEPAWHKTKYLYVKALRQRPKALMRRFGWQSLPYPKPSAVRLLDAPVPTGASKARTLGTAPHSEQAA